MAAQIKNCFERYEKKYRLTAEQQRLILEGMRPYMKKDAYGAKPKVFIAYDRLAFAGIDDPELRITFDTNLRWRDTALDLRLGDYGAPITDPGMILMEIKLPGVCPLWLSQLLSRAEVFPTSFSKYGYCYQHHILPKEGRICA